MQKCVYTSGYEHVIMRAYDHCNFVGRSETALIFFSLSLLINLAIQSSSDGDITKKLRCTHRHTKGFGHPTGYDRLCLHGHSCDRQDGEAGASARAKAAWAAQAPAARQGST